MNRQLTTLVLLFTVAAVTLSGCEQFGKKKDDGKTGGGGDKSMMSSLYDKAGFVTLVEEDNGTQRLWVMRPGEEKSEKHITMVGAGPGGMTLKALDKDTALEYIAAKPGFLTYIEDGRLWVLRPDESASEKHITLVGVGPRGMTVKALDKETAMDYMVSKPGFETKVEDGRLWVLKPGEKMSEKHITLVGAGPMGMTVKALDKETAMQYIYAKPGFEVEVDQDGRLWVLRPGQEKSDKHVTLIGVGPRGETVKGLDRETIYAYLGS